MEIKPIINTIALNASTYTEIIVDRAGSLLMQARESDVDIYLAESASPAAGDYFTLRANASMGIDIIAASASGLFAKAAYGTPTLECIWLKQF